MKLRDISRNILLISITAVLVFSAFTYSVSRIVQRANQETAQAHKILGEITSLRSLTFEYLLKELEVEYV